jgi:two-component system LytT family response regulator
MRRAVLIDDEISARNDLKRLLSQHEGIVVVGEAGRLVESEALLRKGGYDLVFLDVELRGGTSFGLLPAIEPEAVVVFVTAHSHYAVRAFEVNALDYLMKPVIAERLTATLRRLDARGTIETTPATLHEADTVFVKTTAGRSYFLPVADISAVFSRENYSDVFLANGERYFVRRTLKSWEDALPGTQFVRAHRQALANLAHLQNVKDAATDTPQLRLAGVVESVSCSHRLSPQVKLRLAEFAK